MGAARKWDWWTEQKLDILSGYLRGFANASRGAGQTVYLDLFAGQAENASRYRADRVIHGSPRRALEIDPPLSVLRFFELPGNANQLDLKLRADYPNRDFRVVPGDCNDSIATVLGELSHLNWAPTFAFLDQQSTEVRWPTLQQLARHKKPGKSKTELWLLCASGLLPRGLKYHAELDQGVVERMNAMFDTDIWMEALVGVQRGLIDGRQFRAELTNLMRWRMEQDLRYRKTRVFQVKNTSGSEIFDMIFATDHDVGAKIMDHMYKKAMREQPILQLHAQARRKQRQAADDGNDGLFDVDDIQRPPQVQLTGYHLEHQDIPPHPPYRLPRGA